MSIHGPVSNRSRNLFAVQTRKLHSFLAWPWPKPGRARRVTPTSPQTEAETNAIPRPPGGVTIPVALQHLEKFGVRGASAPVATMARPLASIPVNLWKASPDPQASANWGKQMDIREIQQIIQIALPAGREAGVTLERSLALSASIWRQGPAPQKNKS